jgi:hypothetical protein
MFTCCSTLVKTLASFNLAPSERNVARFNQYTLSISIKSVNTKVRLTHEALLTVATYFLYTDNGIY